MKKNHNLFGFIVLLMTLTSCGQDVRFVYDRLTYHTNEFSENMYVDETLEPLIQRVTTTLSTTIPSNEINTIVPTTNDTLGERYAFNNRLSLQLKSLTYGFESKLFDGILFCTDAQRLSKSRLQLLPSGFAYELPSLVETLPSIGLFMKAGADTNAGALKIQQLDVTFTLYIQENGGVRAQSFILPIQNLVQSNFPGYYSFNIPNTISTLGTFAFSFTYQIIAPTPLTEHQSKTGVFLYEVLFPEATFNR
jgi:hypothetical protein